MIKKDIMTYVPVAEVPQSTPGKPGGAVAHVIEDRGRERLFTAAQYAAVNHEVVRIYNLWKEVRFVQPKDMHPDDFRALYPTDDSDEEIRARLGRAQARVVGDQ